MVGTSNLGSWNSHWIVFQFDKSGIAQNCGEPRWENPTSSNYRWSDLEAEDPDHFSPCLMCLFPNKRGENRWKNQVIAMTFLEGPDQALQKPCVLPPGEYLALRVVDIKWGNTETRAFSLGRPSMWRYWYQRLSTAPTLQHHFIQWGCSLT